AYAQGPVHPPGLAVTAPPRPRLPRAIARRVALRSGREDFVGRRRGIARLRSARDHVHLPAHDRGAETVTRGRHRGERAPTVALGVEGLDLIEGAGRRFAADHDDATADHPGRDPAARGRQVAARLPLLSRPLTD